MLKPWMATSLVLMAKASPLAMLSPVMSGMPLVPLMVVPKAVIVGRELPIATCGIAGSNRITA